MFLDRFFLSYRANTHTRTQTQRDSNEYSIVAFSKNATIITDVTRSLPEFWTVLKFSLSRDQITINIVKMRGRKAQILLLF